MDDFSSARPNTEEITFEARHPQISFCMPKKWANTHLCTSKVIPRGAFWKISVARKRGKSLPLFSKWPILGKTA